MRVWRPGRSKLAGGSCGNFDDLLANWRGHRLAVLLEAGQIPGHGVLDVGKGFLARIALRDAAGQRWAFSDEHAVLVQFDHDSIFHAANLSAPLWKVNRHVAKPFSA